MVQLDIVVDSVNCCTRSANVSRHGQAVQISAVTQNMRRGCRADNVETVMGHSRSRDVVRSRRPVNSSCDSSSSGQGSKVVNRDSGTRGMSCRRRPEIAPSYGQHAAAGNIGNPHQLVIDPNEVVWRQRTGVGHGDHRVRVIDGRDEGGGCRIDPSGDSRNVSAQRQRPVHRPIDG